jgi:hypothetical protein
MTSRTHVGLRTLALCSAVAALGCSPKPEAPLPPPPAAKVTRFTVTPGTVARPGDSVTIDWQADNATSVSVEQVGVGPVAGATEPSGTLSVPVQASTVFVITARGEGGSDARAAGVTLTTQAASVLFSALPPTIEAGEASSLTWFAPGAASVALEELGGAVIDIGAQRESGVVPVSPLRDTSYRLTVDGKSSTVAVEVSPVIASFALEGSAPRPGGMATLAWVTRGATRLRIIRDGATSALVDETDAARIAAGTVTDAVPADVPTGGVVTYTLTIEAGARTLTRTLVVRVGRIELQFNANAYAKVGQTVPVSWTTSGAEALTLSVDGRVVFVASTPAEIAAGSYSLTGKSAPQQLELVARNSLGVETRAARTVTPVGPIAFNAYTATPTTLAAGGASATLSWDVANARRVRISQVGGGFASQRTGLLDTGTLTVFPNRATVTYRLEADNQAGDAITPQFVTVSVTTPGVVTVSRKLPTGQSTTITGTTIPGATSITGMPSVTLNAAGEAFVDIAASGTRITGFTTSTGTPNTNDGSALVDVGGFATRLFGRSVSAQRLAVSTNGWMFFSNENTATTVPSVPAGTSLQPLSLVVLGANLDLGTSGNVFWRADVSGGIDRLIVQWDRVQVSAQPGTSLTFQAQVYATGKVVFAYRDVQPGSSTYSAGIVNADETTYLAPMTPPVGNQTLTFFAPVPVTALPVAHTVQSSPYYVTVTTPAGAVEALLDDAVLLGDVYISEANPRPLPALSDAEWIELTNTTSTAFNLEGWSLAVGALTHTFPAGVTVPPNGTLLLAQEANLGDGASVTAGYLYPSTFVMPDASGALALRPPGSSTTYARLDWTAATAPANGRAVQADRPSTSLLVASPFLSPTCPAPTTVTYGGTGQSGTPGATQGRCFPYVLEPLPMGNFESIAVSGTQLVAGSSSDSDDTTYPVTLPQSVQYFGTASTSLSVCTNGWLTTSPSSSTTASNKTLPSTSAPVGSIAPFWDDHAGDPGTMGSGLYWLQRDPDGMPGSGDEVTIVSWEGWRYWSTSNAGQILDFQVKFLANGDLEYHYGRQVVGTYTSGSDATSWIEAPTGTAAMAINVNTTGGIQGNTGFRFRYVP